jgi:hypothetical protein
MKNPFEKAPVVTLRDAYKVPGFRVSAQVGGYEELKHPAYVLTLKRRSKKRFAANAGRYAEAYTASGGGGRETCHAGVGKSISILRCAA